MSKKMLHSQKDVLLPLDVVRGSFLIFQAEKTDE
jgi:hypothetical protein